ASESAGLPSMSPPPSFAATVIARASLVKSLPRRASTIAFLCLIPAHLLCPALPAILVPVFVGTCGRRWAPPAAAGGRRYGRGAGGGAGGSGRVPVAHDRSRGGVRR